MTSDELNAIKARNAARTPEKWAESFRGHCVDVYQAGGMHIATLHWGEPSLLHSQKEKDAQFIAGCSKDVPALIAEVERLTDIEGCFDALLNKLCVHDDKGEVDVAATWKRHDEGETMKRLNEAVRREKAEEEVKQLKALLTLAYHAIYGENKGQLRANLKNDIEAVLEE